MGWTLIESQTLGASAASVTFGSGGTIPQSYKSLALICSARVDISTDNGIYGRFNNNSGTNYSWRSLYGSGSSAQSNNSTSSTSGLIGICSYSTDTANTFGNSISIIPNYTGSTNKPWSLDGINENNATTAYQILTAGLWAQTTAITSLVLLPGSGNFVTGSSFQLYGFK